MKIKLKETGQIRNYINFVKAKCLFLMADIFLCSDNQERFWFLLLKKIESYAKRHEAYFQYLMGKSIASDLFTVVHKKGERFYAWVDEENKALIKFITFYEKKLEKKYPFDDEIIINLIGRSNNER